MMRQRVRLHTPALAYVTRALTVALALILVWYGLMIVLLAVKVAPHTVNSISAYRTLYDRATSVTAADYTTLVRLIAGVGGLLAFFLLFYLALQELPRPHLARGEITLRDDEHGTLRVEPRAIERIAEVAAAHNSDVSQARGRLGDDELNVDVSVRHATTLASTLRDVRQRVTADLERHDLPKMPVNVTLSGYDPKTKRELQ